MKNERIIKIIIIISIIIILLIIKYAIVSGLFDYKNKIRNIHNADIVIVGAGPAGCIVARRLHERFPNKKIVILERGNDFHGDKNIYNIVNANIAAYNPKYSEVIPSGFSTANISIAHMYGGATSHNFALTVRGSPKFYNNKWKDQLDLSYNDLIPIFKRIEHYTPDINSQHQKFDHHERGDHGHLQVTQLPVFIDKPSRIIPAISRGLNHYGFIEGTRMIQRAAVTSRTVEGNLRASNPFSKVVIHAIRKTFNNKVEKVNDYNAGKETCIAKSPQVFVDIALGLRSSVDVAYLPKNYLYWEDLFHKKKSLNLAKLTTVNDLDFDCKGRCQVVNFTNGKGHQKRLKLKKDGIVIMAAGAIYTPFILLKSNLPKGVSPNIGLNMTTHYGTTLIFKTKKNFNYGSGPLSFTPKIIDGKIINEHEREWQTVIGGAPLVDPNLLAVVGLKPNDGNFSTMLTWILKPKSKGFIWLNELNPLQPNINLNLYSDKDDTISIVNSLRWMYKVILEMRCNIGDCDDVKVVFPPENVLIRDNNTELEQWAKTGLSLTDHYNGTCALGDVVDPHDFRIKGTKNVFAVDASVFPEIPNGNTEFPVCVMAEVASDRISHHLVRH